MLILLAIVMALLGLWQMVNPRGNWRATEGWKYRDPDANEPSEVSYGLRSLGGLFTIVMAAVLAGLGMQAGSLGVSKSGSSADDTYSGPCPPYMVGCYSDDSSPAPRPTASGKTVDPFSSAVASPVAGGEPVTLFTPVVEGEVQRDQSDSSKQIGVKPVYYPWTASDQPAAFASAAVINSKIALATLDPAQATTQGAGAADSRPRALTSLSLSVTSWSRRHGTTRRLCTIRWRRRRLHPEPPGTRRTRLLETPGQARPTTATISRLFSDPKGGESSPRYGRTLSPMLILIAIRSSPGSLPAHSEPYRGHFVTTRPGVAAYGHP